jgi:hypothetical protein
MIQSFLWAAGMMGIVILCFALLYEIYDQLKNR